MAALIRDDGSGYLRQLTNPGALPTYRRNNRQRKCGIQDHPEWLAYLTARRIIKPALAAGAWIEYNDYYGRYCLVWHEKRRDDSRGARRRRFIDPPTINGNKIGKSIWFSGEKTDEPFHYVGTLAELIHAIALAHGEVHIVEGEFGVWSLRPLSIRNAIGIYGSTNIPKDIAALLDELGVKKFVYYADNDKVGEQGAAKLLALLLEAGWPGEAEYRQFSGPGIPEKGDANDLLCHHYPDLSAARAAPLCASRKTKDQA